MKKFCIIAFAPLFIICVVFIPWLNKVFSSRLMVFLGNISFELFIWHFPVQIMFKIIEIIYERHFDYTRIRTWLAYVCVVFAVVIIYKKYMANRLNNIYKLFIK